MQLAHKHWGHTRNSETPEWEMIRAVTVERLPTVLELLALWVH